MQFKNSKAALPLTGFIIAFAGSILFSTKAVIVKMAFEQTHTDALTLLTLRMVFSLPFFIGAAIWVGNKKDNPSLSARHWLSIIALGLFGYYISSLFDFIGLQYYPISDEYFVFADFTPFETTDTIALPTSKAGDFRKMIRYGKLNFQIAESKSLVLIAYKELENKQDQLFVPFKDKTSGFTTYQAGRYLEISEPDEQQMCIIDFNRAYNPYCAYNAEYSCPLIPSENILPVFIKAGEKNPPSK